jgi:Putative zinc-finger
MGRIRIRDGAVMAFWNRADKALIVELRSRLGQSVAELTERRASAAYWLERWKSCSRVIAQLRVQIAKLDAQVAELTCGDLLAFVDGELDEERTESFRLHLHTCVACQAELVNNAQLNARIATMAQRVRVDRAVAAERVDQLVGTLQGRLDRIAEALGLAPGTDVNAMVSAIGYLRDRQAPP